MHIKARMGVSIDGYVATTDGTPSVIKAAAFVPGQSHGYPEFIDGCDTVVMGRQTFLPALAAPQWLWGDMQVFVLTSRPLPPQTPKDVVSSTGGPAGLVKRLRPRASGDVHLVGGPRTIQAFCQQGHSTASTSSCCRSCSATAFRCGRAEPHRAGCGCGANRGSSRTALPNSATRRPDPLLSRRSPPLPPFTPGKGELL